MREGQGEKEKKSGKQDLQGVGRRGSRAAELESGQIAAEPSRSIFGEMKR